jgi:hypothetical protein
MSVSKGHSKFKFKYAAHLDFIDFPGAYLYRSLKKIKTKFGLETVIIQLKMVDVVRLFTQTFYRLIRFMESKIYPLFSICFFPRKMALVFGGWFEFVGPRIVVQGYDPQSDQWSQWEPEDLAQQSPTILPYRGGAGCVSTPEAIYVIGGHDGRSAVKSVYR